MHVASEAGDYIFKKLHPMNSALNREAALLELEAAAVVAGAGAGAGMAVPGIPEPGASAPEDQPEVCGLYVIGEPDTIVEITMKHYDANCETGALMAVTALEESNLYILICGPYISVCGWVGAEWRVLPGH